MAALSAGEPLFVIKLDAARARVVVGPREALATRRVRLRALNWIGPGTIEDHAKGEDIFVQTRSSRPPVQGFLFIGPEDAAVEFAAAEDGVSPGQACVFYSSDQRVRTGFGRRLHCFDGGGLPGRKRKEYARADSLPL